MSDELGVDNVVMLVSSDGFAGVARHYRLFEGLTPGDIASLSDAAKDALRPLMASSACYYWVPREARRIEAMFTEALEALRGSWARRCRACLERLRAFVLRPRRDELTAWSLATELECTVPGGPVADALGEDAWSSLARGIRALRGVTDGAYAGPRSAWDQALEAWMQEDGQHLPSTLELLHVLEVAGSAWRAWAGASPGSSPRPQAFWEALSMAAAARGFPATTAGRMRDVAEAAARLVDGP